MTALDLYDEIGRGYSAQRRADPRIAAGIWAALGDARTILNVVGFPILSKAFFTANPFDSSQLNPPLGSGAYKVGRWSAGKSFR